MCNAWNHSLSCNCGWGSGNYVNSNFGGANNFFAPRIANIVTTVPFSNNHDIESKTHLTPCPWCGEYVYYHTNGYGDSVYFDSLGYPWQIHGCFEQYRKSERYSNHKNSKSSSLYQLQNFFRISINEQKRLILIGTAQHIQNTQISEYFVYGLTELSLAEAMSISIDRLRDIYGSLYFVKLNGIGFFTDKQKRLKLLQVADKIPNVIVGKFLIYNASEDCFINQMGISLEYFRESYGHLYLQESTGIKIFTEQELENRQNSRFRARKYKNLTKAVQKINASKPSNTKTISQAQAHVVKQTKSRPLVLCPHCKIRVRNDRLSIHVSKKCVIASKTPK